MTFWIHAIQTIYNLLLYHTGQGREGFIIYSRVRDISHAALSWWYLDDPLSSWWHAMHTCMIHRLGGGFIKYSSKSTVHILKSRLAARFTIYNYWALTFWEIALSRLWWRHARGRIKFSKISCQWVYIVNLAARWRLRNFTSSAMMATRACAMWLSLSLSLCLVCSLSLSLSLPLSPSLSLSPLQLSYDGDTRVRRVTTSRTEKGASDPQLTTSKFVPLCVCVCVVYVNVTR